ncbi:hypothetical protein BD779DRAFT_1480160 [Infundibulicybe gibba]|nr:hypothetical protein BD779DRAFT_1480160 [Infundibulicybe gibba]
MSQDDSILSRYPTRSRIGNIATCHPASASTSPFPCPLSPPSIGPLDFIAATTAESSRKREQMGGDLMSTRERMRQGTSACMDQRTGGYPPNRFPTDPYSYGSSVSHMEVRHGRKSARSAFGRAPDIDNVLVRESGGRQWRS